MQTIRVPRTPFPHVFLCAECHKFEQHTVKYVNFKIIKEDVYISYHATCIFHSHHIKKNVAPVDVWNGFIDHDYTLKVPE